VGVVVQMNTRLDQIPLNGLGAWNIAVDIARITMGYPTKVQSSRGFYFFWWMFDGILLLLIASIIWQAIKLRNWRKRYHVLTPFKKTVVRISILLEILLCFVILILPNLINSRWDIFLYHRPDFSFPLLIIGSCFGALGIVKALLSFLPYNTQVTRINL
jgi:hypothetical protein